MSGVERHLTQQIPGQEEQKIAEVIQFPKRVFIVPQENFTRTLLQDPRKETEETKKTWWKNATVCQIMTRSFYDTKGNGEGDLRGIIEKADYIKDMGYDAIWLNPMFSSPHKDNGYDITNYMGVDEKYGTRKDLKDLIQTMNEKGIKVLLDLVANHTSDEHPWFRRSRESKNSITRDVYIWRPGKTVDGQMEPPNNWIACFGDPAWTYDEKTGEYYFHKFAVGQPDLNLRHPSVREHMKKIVKQWLDMGIAGIRMDTADIYFEDSTFSDATANPHYRPGTDSVYEKFTMRDKFEVEEENNLYLKEIMDVLDQYRAVGIGEVNSNDLPHLQRLYTEATMHVPFNFNLMRTVNKYGLRPNKLKESMDEYMQIIPEGSCASIVFDNHDQQKRLADRVGDNLRPLTMLQMTFGSEGGCMAFIHYGDDIGMPSGSVTEETMDDVYGKNEGLQFSRDFSRTPMQWNDTPKNAGFSVNPEANPWLPIGDPKNGNNVADQIADPDSMLNLTKQLIKLRTEQPALGKGKYVPYETNEDDTIVFGRVTENQKCLVLLNFSKEPKLMELPHGSTDGTIMVSTNCKREKDTINGKVKLGKNEGVIIEIKNEKISRTVH